MCHKFGLQTWVLFFCFLVLRRCLFHRLLRVFFNLFVALFGGLVVFWVYDLRCVPKIRSSSVGFISWWCFYSQRVRDTWRGRPVLEVLGAGPRSAPRLLARGPGPPPWRGGPDIPFYRGGPVLPGAICAGPRSSRDPWRGGSLLCAAKLCDLSDL